MFSLKIVNYTSHHISYSISILLPYLFLSMCHTERFLCHPLFIFFVLKCHNMWYEIAKTLSEKTFWFYHRVYKLEIRNTNKIKTFIMFACRIISSCSFCLLVITPIYIVKNNFLCQNWFTARWLHFDHQMTQVKVMISAKINSADSVMPRLLVDVGIQVSVLKQKRPSCKKSFEALKGP